VNDRDVRFKAFFKLSRVRTLHGRCVFVLCRLFSYRMARVIVGTSYNSGKQHQLENVVSTMKTDIIA
jgi:hypothetical protein